MPPKSGSPHVVRGVVHPVRAPRAGCRKPCTGVTQMMASTTPSQPASDRHSCCMNVHDTRPRPVLGSYEAAHLQPGFVSGASGTALGAETAHGFATGSCAQRRRSFRVRADTPGGARFRCTASSDDDGGTG